MVAKLFVIVGVGLLIVGVAGVWDAVKERDCPDKSRVAIGLTVFLAGVLAIMAGVAIGA